MMAKQRTPSVYQRNAFAPGLLAAAVLATVPRRPLSTAAPAAEAVAR